MDNIANTFSAAVQLHTAGKLREAEAIYRQILEVDPRHADAIHLLGLVAHQTGRHVDAQECISRAIALRGDRPAYHSNLGEVQRAIGKLPEARQSYELALRLNPNFPEAHNNLGNVLQAMDRNAEAVQAYEQAIKLRPNYAEAHDNLGALLREQGNLPEAIESHLRAVRLAPNQSGYQLNLGLAYQAAKKLEEAVGCYREAARLNPRSALAYNNLGGVLKQRGRLDEAIDCYRAALDLQPELAEAHYNLGNVFVERDDPQAAAEAYRAALQIRPDYVDAMVNLANLQLNQGEWEQALALCQRAVAVQPDFALAHFNLGNIHHSQKKSRQAIAAYREALRLEPNHPETYNNLSVVFNEMNRPDSALEICRRGLEVAPGFGSIYANMAIALHSQGRGDEAIDACRKAVALRPGDAAEYSNLLYSLNFHSGYDSPTLFGEHLEWARRYAEPLTVQAAPHANDRTRDRRLRIGYLSPYFRQHAVNYFTEPMLAAHDHEQFEIFCYADAHGGDAATDRLKKSADHWREVTYRSDEQVARQVREDGIDILVDLTGHIGNNRLLVFARKPAPIQVTYIGYQNTTGMTAMDYRITDALADPPGLTDAFYTEKLVRLPRSFFCYRPPDDSPPPTPLPALGNGYVTFGSFNKFAKVTPQTIAAWLKILVRLPESRLLVLAHRGGALEQRLRRLAAEQGIDPARIELCEQRPHGEYMRLIQRADIALDPFPFNGHTTTCDSIWVGVPVVALQGDSYVSRFGGSVLANVGLEHLIATSVDGYIETAVELARGLKQLAHLRAELRPRMARSALLDFVGFTRHLERAYRQMWINWCDTT